MTADPPPPRRADEGEPREREQASGGGAALPAGGPGAAELEKLTAALDAVVQLSDDVLGHGPLLLALLKQNSRFESALCRGSAAFERGASWSDDGARNAATWLSRSARESKPAGNRRLRIGRALEHLPLAAAAFEAGEIGISQAETIASLDRPSTAPALRRAEAEIVERARTLSLADFNRSCCYLVQHANEPASERGAAAQRERRSSTFYQRGDGSWIGSALLDPVAGEIVTDELDRLYDELFGNDVACATERLGHRASPDELERTPAQRRADALVAMATRSAAARGDLERPAALFSVLIDFPSFGRICELASGTVVTPGSLVPYLDQAAIERAVFAAPNRIEVSARARFFTGATRRAIELRDRHCVHPFCDIPAKRCQVDHVVPYSAGGETTQDNGRVYCEPHNKRRVWHEEPPAPPQDDEPVDKGTKARNNDPPDRPGNCAPTDRPPGPEPPSG